MVQPKKYLGQHFLKDKDIALRIVNSLSGDLHDKTILEVGPGTGILTDILFDRYPETTRIVDIDVESIQFLRARYPGKSELIWEEDFLKLDFAKIPDGKLVIIGNFPYNISSQILFRVYNNHDRVLEVVGMVQKEVGERIASPPGKKTYGILSVLLGVFYDIEYLFTVAPGVFHPPPKVDSGVIRLRRNDRVELPFDPAFFTKIVKEGFQKRRKTLRNALKALNLPGSIKQKKILDLRAEQLSVNDFIQLTSEIELHWKK